ncbi:uncharacterized protein LOC117344002 [Pecten maximus]|uniref:uncharacterized protein LOC117344002 n=1 Tax=Pecten maximus TaxID=6579 RepID=UPI001458525F|nr:uncharacterized protein LOC117344002 [Pecten maximus]
MKRKCLCCVRLHICSACIELLKKRKNILEDFATDFSVFVLIYCQRDLQRHMMNLGKRTVVLLWVITAICSSVATDPCNTANVLPNMDKRGLSDHPPPGSRPIDDHYNIPDGGSWYRVEGQQMLTSISTAGLEMCGTTFPIYMQGAIPKLTDGIVSRTVCTITFGNTCSHPQHIKIKVCQDFTAYFLSPPRSTGSAYCFVTEDETSVAPTYLIPKPSLSNKLVTEGFYQRLQFKCSFEPSLEDLYYQVFWFVDDKPLNVSKMAKKTEPETFVLQEKTGVLEKLGINIACSVRAKTKPDGVPGPMSQKSALFFAGITVCSHKKKHLSIAKRKAISVIFYKQDTDMQMKS